MAASSQADQFQVRVCMGIENLEVDSLKTTYDRMPPGKSSMPRGTQFEDYCY